MQQIIVDTLQIKPFALLVFLLQPLAEVCKETDGCVKQKQCNTVEETITKRMRYEIMILGKFHIQNIVQNEPVVKKILNDVCLKFTL
jgi:hypothetical protein